MTKKIRKHFGISDYLEEERFLQDQHRQGWKMTGYHPLTFTYIFEECPPEEYIYQMDFKEQGQADEDYLQLFEDCGWEYFHKYNEWYYFRKKKSAAADENSIFNDAPSKAEMAKKVLYRYSVFPFLLLFMTSIAYQSSEESSLSPGIPITVICVLTFLLLLNFKQVLKLQKIIKQNTQI